MSISIILAIGVFCAMQVIAQLFFKWGSTSDSRWLWGFLAGNAFGFSSIWLLMLIYRSMNVNIALGICSGASFLLAQLALAIISLINLADKIKYVVDSAPFKQGKYTPATHLPIVAPDTLISDPVDAVIVMAAGYSDEVVRIIRQKFDRNINIAILRDFGLEVV